MVASLGFDSPNHDLKEFRGAYKELAKVAHPDRGGSDKAMARLNWAMEKATKSK